MCWQLKNLKKGRKTLGLPLGRGQSSGNRRKIHRNKVDDVSSIERILGQFREGWYCWRGYYCYLTLNNYVLYCYFSRAPLSHSRLYRNQIPLNLHLRNKRSAYKAVSSIKIFGKNYEASTWVSLWCNNNSWNSVISFFWKCNAFLCIMYVWCHLITIFFPKLKRYIF